jgi:hypothetical protein
VELLEELELEPFDELELDELEPLELDESDDEDEDDDAAAPADSLLFADPLVELLAALLAASRLSVR